MALSSPLEPSGAEITCASFAFIDPELRIDAAFLAAHPDAGLTLPPGVGNEITAVPEHGAAWLMFGGLGLLGGVVARGRPLPTTQHEPASLRNIAYSAMSHHSP